MKKVLFATTALVATASVAAADVRISGYGRFGLDYNDGNGRPAAAPAANTPFAAETTITSRLRLQFDMTTETDNGVAFGARFRAQAESRDNNPNITRTDSAGDTVTLGGGALFNGARFYVTSGGFTLGVGNIIGAFEGATGLYLETRTAGIGIDGAGFESTVGNVNGEAFNWDAYSSGGTGVNGVEVLYSAGAFGAHVSYSQRRDTITPANTIIDGADRAAINLRYTFGDWTAGLAYQDSSVQFEDKLLVSIAGEIGPVGLRFAYADNDGIGKFGIYANMDIGAASNILVYATSEDAVDAADLALGRANNTDGVAGSNNREGTGYGIHYSYDLGGGVSFEAGAREASNDNTTVQAGVYFSF